MPSLLKKVNALRRLHFLYTEVNQNFYYELTKLDVIHDKNIKPLLDKNMEIFNGFYEPTETETDFPLTYVEIPVKECNDPVENKIKGIPGFWLITLNNMPTFWSMIESYDVEPLKYLIDIRAETEIDKNLILKIDFFFSPNKFFKNSVLTKKYMFNFIKDQKFRVNSCKTQLLAAVGSIIDWKIDNLTMDTTKQNKKRRSFFNFFNPPMLTEANLKIERYLQIDYKLGIEFKKIIPHAVQYYLGEAVLRGNFGLENEYDQITDWITFYENNMEEEFILEHNNKKDILQSKHFDEPLQKEENSGYSTTEKYIKKSGDENVRVTRDFGDTETDLSSKNEKRNDIVDKQLKKQKTLEETVNLQQQVIPTIAANNLKDVNNKKKTETIKWNNGKNKNSSYNQKYSATIKICPKTQSGFTQS